MVHFDNGGKNIDVNVLLHIAIYSSDALRIYFPKNHMTDVYLMKVFPKRIK